MKDMKNNSASMAFQTARDWNQFLILAENVDKRDGISKTFSNLNKNLVNEAHKLVWEIFDSLPTEEDYIKSNQEEKELAQLTFVYLYLVIDAMEKNNYERIEDLPSLKLMKLY